MPTVRDIKVDEIEIDLDLQPRATVDHDLTLEYEESMECGDTFPPITVFRDKKERYWLADGFHRVFATMRRQHAKIKAEVRMGSRRDALLYSTGANATHGERRTNADKRRGVMVLLDDPTWSGKPNAWIAKKCRVSENFVKEIRHESLGIETSRKTNPISSEKQSQQKTPKVTSGRHRLVVAKKAASSNPIYMGADQTATMVIAHLQSIHKDDGERKTALSRVKQWIERELQKG